MKLLNLCYGSMLVRLGFSGCYSHLQCSVTEALLYTLRMVQGKSWHSMINCCKAWHSMHSMAQLGTIAWHSVAQRGIAYCSVAQSSTAWHSAAKHGTACTAWHSAAQHAAHLNSAMLESGLDHFLHSCGLQVGCMAGGAQLGLKSSNGCGGTGIDDIGHPVLLVGGLGLLGGIRPWTCNAT